MPPRARALASMAQVPTRRKRTIVETDDEDDLQEFELQLPSSALAKLLRNSPSKPSQPASPSPIKSQPSPPVFRHTPPKPAVRGDRWPSYKTPLSSPHSSPEKVSRGRPQKRVKFVEMGETTDAAIVFSSQVQKTQEPKTNGNGSSGQDALDLLLEDIFSSDSATEEDFDGHRASSASSASVAGQDGQKSTRRTNVNAMFPPADSFAPAASQQFSKPARPSRPDARDDDLRPWAERYGPVNLDELAVHKRKVADVRRWLEGVFDGRIRQRLLVLKGAAGSGKTTTLRLLAQELGCEILEWRNPTGGASASASASAAFRTFLGDGTKFGLLDTFEPGDELASQASRPGVGSQRRTKIILVEEFPNTFSRGSSALVSFRNSIQTFLADATYSSFGPGQAPETAAVTPVVMVISETLLATTSASADSFTAHRLLGPEILRHPGTGVIEFNAIAPTLLARALELIVQKEARKSGRKRTPGPPVLKQLGEIGDVRSAISSLEFLCLKGDQEADWGASVTFAKPKRGGAASRGKQPSSLTKGERDSLQLVSRREASLGIFHAVGKVVYNKREGAAPAPAPAPALGSDSVEEALPAHRSHHARPRRSLVSVDDLIDETGTDTHTFISALHENYALSCEPAAAEDPASSVDYLNDCIEHLSASDLLCPSRDIFFGGGGFPAGAGMRDAGSHILRQDEMAFQVAVRGLLFSLPFPVRRKAPGWSRNGMDGNKMFYPTSLKLWRAKEETEGLVDMWSRKFLRGEDGLERGGGPSLDGGDGHFRKPAGAGVALWADAHRATSAPRKPAEPDAMPLLSLGNAARNEMVLERLPYTAHVARARARARARFGGSASPSLLLRDLERIVSFRGIGPPSEELDEEGTEPGGTLPGEAWATDKPTEEEPPRKRRTARNITESGEGREDLSGLPGLSGLSGLPIQKLMLSDDEIEDDWD